MQKAQTDFSIKRLPLLYEITVFCSAAPQHPPNISKTKLPVVNIYKKTFLKPLFTKALKTNTLCFANNVLFKKDHPVTAL